MNSKIVDLSSLNQQQKDFFATLKTPQEKRAFLEQFNCLKQPERILNDYSFGKETKYNLQNNMEVINDK